MSLKMASATPHHEGTSKAFDDEMNGKDGLQFKPRDLNIVWGNDRRYWDIPEDDQKPAELLQVCWLEVTGSAKNTNPDKEYEVTFNLSFTSDAFGWGSCDVFVMVKRGKKGKFASKRLQSSRFLQDSERFDISCKSSKAADKQDGELYFGLYEVWSGKWKGGLKIHKATVKRI